MLAVLSLLLLAAPTPSAGVAAIAEFKAAYKKTYLSADEEALRLAAFAASLREIEAINRGASGWIAGLNQFSDLTWPEFQQSVLMSPQNCSATMRRAGRTTAPTYLRAARHRLARLQRAQRGEEPAELWVVLGRPIPEKPAFKGEGPGSPRALQWRAVCPSPPMVTSPSRTSLSPPPRANEEGDW
eukprot:CAMPEP_0180090650 /NCGR_PEP_ID=MMETSP0985-20121206/23548_1 /TAXON_ID=483367 /ORGANISM="non described non described, Strain CCMP 2436" /LENGTH=184 /DNA_ID=CAMNT_0022025473 /DNA_START=218 /DNA_END=769 /DNA_ORIENTATION=-